MNNINKFDDFINEGLFSKSLNEYIEKIDELFIDLYDMHGKVRGIEVIEIKLDIAELLNSALMKFGRTMKQEDMDKFMKRFNEIISTIDMHGYNKIIKNYEKFKDVINSILQILNHLKRFYGLDINFEKHKDLLQDYLVFYKRNGGYYILVPSAYAEKKNKEARAGHENVDPLGEENWND